MRQSGGKADARIYSLLLQIRILRSCSDDDLMTIGRSAEVVRYVPGQEIAGQDECPQAISFVAFGKVRLKLLGEGRREIILTEIEAGGFFGDESLAGLPTRRATAMAIDETTVVAIAADVFRAFLGAHPGVALSFGMHLSRQLHGAFATVAGLGLLSVEDRLLRALEQLGHQHGSARDDGLLLHTLPTHRELAARVGACRETVTRAFLSLARRGLVVTCGPTLLLTPAALQRA